MYPVNRQGEDMGRKGSALNIEKNLNKTDF